MSGPRRTARSWNILCCIGDPAAVEAATAAFASAGVPHALRVAGNPSQALSLLGSAPDTAPDLVLLDLGAGNRQGSTLLSRIKGASATAHLPVIVLWPPECERDVLGLYRLHANCCLRRPDAPDAYRDLIREVARFWFAGGAILPVRPGGVPHDVP